MILIWNNKHKNTCIYETKMEELKDDINLTLYYISV